MTGIIRSAITQWRLSSTCTIFLISCVKRKNNDFWQIMHVWVCMWFLAHWYSLPHLRLTHLYFTHKESDQKLTPIICLITFFLAVVNTLGSIWTYLKARRTYTLEGPLLVDTVTIFTYILHSAALIHIWNNDAATLPWKPIWGMTSHLCRPSTSKIRLCKGLITKIIYFSEGDVHRELIIIATGHTYAGHSIPGQSKAFRTVTDERAHQVLAATWRRADVLPLDRATRWHLHFINII